MWLETTRSPPARPLSITTMPPWRQRMSTSLIRSLSSGPITQTFSPSRTSELGKRYLAKLSEQEDQIERLDKAIADLAARTEAKKKTLHDFVAGLNTE